MTIRLKVLTIICLAVLAAWGGLQYAQKTELSARLARMEAELKRAEDRYEVSVARAKALQAAAQPRAAQPASNVAGSNVVAEIFNKLPMNPDRQRETLLAEIKSRLGLTDGQERLVAIIIHDFNSEKQAAMNKAARDGIFPLGQDFMTIVNSVRIRALARLREALSEDQYARFTEAGYDDQLGMRVVQQ